MRVFKNIWFAKFARKENINNKALLGIVDKLEEGHYDADLGGGVFKIRLARSGEGKAGGYRIILYYKSNLRTVFAYGFSKSDRDNIEDDELLAFKNRAKDILSLTDEQINARIKKGTLFEILKR